MEVKITTGIPPKGIERSEKKPEISSMQIDTQDIVIKDAPSPEKPAIHKKWTILSYAAGDNNLEPYMTATVDRMELAGSDFNTHIIAQLDRGPNPKSTVDPGWKNCRRYYVVHDEKHDKINSPILAQFNKTNMADPKVLKDFLVWGMKAYPSDYVALILNDHGLGFLGAMEDVSDYAPSPRDYMSTGEIGWAVREAEKEAGKKINVIGFNACLMANIETAYQLKDSADYLVGSEEIEYMLQDTPGWTIDNNYKEKVMKASGIMGEAIKSFQKNLAEKINMTPKELAKLIVTTGAKHKNLISTMSAVDLKEIPNVANAVKDLGTAIKKTNQKEAVRNAFKNAECYCFDWAPYVDEHDFQHACKNLIKNCPDEDVKKAAQKVIETTKKAVIANAVNPNPTDTAHGDYHIPHPESTGVSIYAPVKKNTYYAEKYSQLAFEQDTKWLESLSAVQEDSKS